MLVWSNGDRQEGDYGEEMLGRRHSCEAVAIGEKETVGEKKVSGRRYSYEAMAMGKKETVGKKC